MIPTSALTSIIPLFLAVLTFIVVMLLPALIELKKPKDAGPRIIKDYDYITLPDLDMKIYLSEDGSYTEEELKVDNLIILKEVAVVLATLPNMES